MKSALRSLVVILTLVLTLNLTAFAIPTSNTQKQKKDSLSKIQLEIEKVERKLEEFDNEIEKVMA